MLSEILEAAAPTRRTSRPGRAPGLSISQLYPCPYRLYKVHRGEFWGEKITPQQHYNMADGWDQEEQSVRRLAEAGVRIGDRTPERRMVNIGRSKVPGSHDGTVILGGKKKIWEHKAYDGDSEAVWMLRNHGLDRMPSQKSQINGYILGAGLDEGVFFVKVKNNNTYLDKGVPLDRPFIEGIVEWCDRIRLEDWIPEPVECEWCASCGLDCFGTILDFSWLESTSDREMAKKWVEGDKYKKIGEMLIQDAREYFVGERGVIGDRDLLSVEDLLEVKKIVQHRFEVSKQRVLEEFGPEGLIKVGEEKDIIQYRFRSLK